MLDEVVLRIIAAYSTITLDFLPEKRNGEDYFSKHIFPLEMKIDLCK